jgi:zinc transport system ATP-binding protein
VTTAGRATHETAGDPAQGAGHEGAHRAPGETARGAGHTAGEVLLRCEGLEIGHAGRALLPPLDLELRRGRVLLVVGRNGAGKSTWLATLLGLVPPVRGRIVRRQPPPRMAYIPQSAGLDEILPVRAGRVVSWGRLRRWSFLWPFARRADQEACRDALVQVAAERLIDQPFHELSGGQQQRVLFARLLASEADLALLDEPTASMDVPGQIEAYERIAWLARARDMAVIVVSHTLGIAAAYAHEVLFVDRSGEGRERDAVVVRGTPDEVSAHPRFVRVFGAAALGSHAEGA